MQKVPYETAGLTIIDDGSDQSSASDRIFKSLSWQEAKGIIFFGVGERLNLREQRRQRSKIFLYNYI